MKTLQSLKAITVSKDHEMEEKEITEIWADGTENPLKASFWKREQRNSGRFIQKDQYLYLIPINDNAEEVAADGAGGCTSGDIQIGFHYDIVSKRQIAAMTIPNTQ